MATTSDYDSTHAINPAHAQNDSDKSLLTAAAEARPDNTLDNTLDPILDNTAAKPAIQQANFLSRHPELTEELAASATSTPKELEIPSDDANSSVSSAEHAHTIDNPTTPTGEQPDLTAAALLSPHSDSASAESSTAAPPKKASWLQKLAKSLLAIGTIAGIVVGLFVPGVNAAIIAGVVGVTTGAIALADKNKHFNTKWRPWNNEPFYQAGKAPKSPWSRNLKKTTIGLGIVAAGIGIASIAFPPLGIIAGVMGLLSMAFPFVVNFIKAKLAAKNSLSEKHQNPVSSTAKLENELIKPEAGHTLHPMTAEQLAKEAEIIGEPGKQQHSVSEGSTPQAVLPDTTKKTATTDNKAEPKEDVVQLREHPN